MQLIYNLFIIAITSRFPLSFFLKFLFKNRRYFKCSKSKRSHQCLNVYLLLTIISLTDQVPLRWSFTFKVFLSILEHIWPKISFLESDV